MEVTITRCPENTMPGKPLGSFLLTAGPGSIIGNYWLMDSALRRARRITNSKTYTFLGDPDDRPVTMPLYGPGCTAGCTR